MKKLFIYFVLTFAFFIGVTTEVDAAVSQSMSCPSTTNHCVGYQSGSTGKSGLADGQSYYFYYPKAVKWTGGSFKFQDSSAPTFTCNSGQTPTRSVDNSDCVAQAGVTYNTTKTYYCNVKYTVGCPAAPQPQPTPQPTPQPEPQTKETISTARSKTNSPSPKTQKTQKTAAPVPVTEVTTESTTAAPSNNTNIKLILINKKSISYKSSKDEYKFTVAYGIKSVEVDVDLEDPKATYKVEGNSNFDDEKPTEDIVITVTAEDGTTTKTVTIKAEKFKPSETDCTLANIYIKDYAINYERNTFEYTVTLGKEVTNLDIETIKQYDGQIVNVSGNEKLKNKSKIIVEVESPAGDICKYEIKVKKNTSVLKYFIIILVLLIALGVAGYFLYRYINKSNGLYKYE